MDMELESGVHEPFSDTEQYKTKVKNADNDCPTSSIFEAQYFFFLQRQKKNSRLNYLRKRRYAIEKEDMTDMPVGYANQLAMI